MLRESFCTWFELDSISGCGVLVTWLDLSLSLTLEFSKLDQSTKVRPYKLYDITHCKSFERKLRMSPYSLNRLFASIGWMTRDYNDSGKNWFHETFQIGISKICIFHTFDLHVIADPVTHKILSIIQCDVLSFWSNFWDKISVFGFRTAKNLVLMSKRENLVIHATKIMRVNYFHLLLQKLEVPLLRFLLWFKKEILLSKK